jgi:regulator of sirC expression with transglutaminase-like and TPR domain
LLAIVYIEVARRCGVDMVGVGFPGHFIVAPAESEAPFFVDVFDAGAVLRPHHLRAWAQARTGPIDERAFARWVAPVDNRRILARVCMNLKNAWLRAGNLEGALRASERLILLYPQRLREHHERAMLLAQLGRPRERAPVTWSAGGPVGES